MKNLFISTSVMIILLAGLFAFFAGCGSEAPAPDKSAEQKSTAPSVDNSEPSPEKMEAAKEYSSLSQEEQAEVEQAYKMESELEINAENAAAALNALEKEIQEDTPE